jgi:hypothetical protein
LVSESRRDYVSSHKPEIPYVIWGNVEVDGVKITKESGCTILMKVGNESGPSCQLGTLDRYEDFYVLDAPSTADRSQQVELYVQFQDTVLKAATVSPGIPGEVMRVDISVRPIPQVSLLHRNYPNPFNPDTWIPYQLREDTHVEIRIYSVTGQLIRTLDLGHKPAGFYTDRQKAAYWDGKNEVGEQTASGVYFYSIQAGNFAATKKMVVAK